MLVLQRQKEESIRIGDEIRITIIAIRGGKVVLGIDAPEGVLVFRDELWEAVKRHGVTRKKAKEHR